MRLSVDEEWEVGGWFEIEGRMVGGGGGGGNGLLEVFLDRVLNLLIELNIFLFFREISITWWMFGLDSDWRLSLSYCRIEIQYCFEMDWIALNLGCDAECRYNT